MKKLFSFFLLFASLVVFSQSENPSPPNYKKIKKNIENSSSSFYYKTLIDRFHKADESLSTEEMKHLYFGFTFQKEYSPYERHHYSDSISVILRNETLDNEHFNAIEKYAAEMFIENPFSIRTLTYLSLAQEKLGKDNSKSIIQINLIAKAILDTGDGISKKSALFVTHVVDEYDVLNLLGFKYAGQHKLVDGIFDLLKIEKNKYGIDALFFEVSPSMNHLVQNNSEESKK